MSVGAGDENLLNGNRRSEGQRTKEERSSRKNRRKRSRKRRRLQADLGGERWTESSTGVCGVTNEFLDTTGKGVKLKVSLERRFEVWGI